MRPAMRLGEELDSRMKARDGADPIPLELAFRLYAPYVAYIGTRILGRGSDVEDLVQDVFIEAASALRSLHDRAALKSWLSTLTVRVAVRRLRARKLRRFFRLDDETDRTTIAWPGASPEQCALIAELFRLLDRVPARRRAAWVLRRFEEEPLDEIARKCGCSLATAKRWVESTQLWIDGKMKERST